MIHRPVRLSPLPTLFYQEIVLMTLVAAMSAANTIVQICDVCSRKQLGLKKREFI